MPKLTIEQITCPHRLVLLTSANRYRVGCIHCDLLAEAAETKAEALAEWERLKK